MATAIHCLDCDFELKATTTGRCPECGRAFDPASPRTFASRSRRGHALRGLLFAVVLAAVAFGLLRWSWEWPYGDAHEIALRSIFGVGLLVAAVAAVTAAVNRSWIGRIPLLLVGVLSVWAGLFFGLDKFYRVWQGSSDPPDEAFADTAPLGALLAGWIPGGLFVGVVFAAALLVLAWRRRGAPRSGAVPESVPGSGPGSVPGSPAAANADLPHPPTTPPVA